MLQEFFDGMVLLERGTGKDAVRGYAFLVFMEAPAADGLASGVHAGANGFADKAEVLPRPLGPIDPLIAKAVAINSKDIGNSRLAFYFASKRKVKFAK